MPLVKFTQTRVVQDNKTGTPDEERYEAGQIYDLPEASAERWKRRDCAVDPTPDEEAAFRAPRARALAKKVVDAGYQATKLVSDPKPAPPAPPAPEPLVRSGSKLEVALKTDDLVLTAPASAPVAAPAVERVDIPVDYKNFSWPRLKALATRISKGSVNTRDDALKIVEEELARQKTP